MESFAKWVLAFVPTLILMWYFRRRDLNPEPARVVWTTFLLGCVAVVPVLLIPTSLVVAQVRSPVLGVLASAFVQAAIPEELSKLLVLLGYSTRHREFDEAMDGVVYGAIAALGFATVENVSYVSQGGLGTALSRGIFAVPGHAFDGAIMGYYLGQTRLGRRRVVYALLWPVIIHGLYDFLLMVAPLTGSISSGLPWLAVIAAHLLVLGAALWTFRITRSLRQEQLALAKRGVHASLSTALKDDTLRDRRRAALWRWSILLCGMLMASTGALCLAWIASTMERGAVLPDAGPVLPIALSIGIAPLTVGLILVWRGLALRRRTRSDPPSDEAV